MIRKIQSIHSYWFHACLNNLTLLFRSKHDNALCKFITWVWIWTLGSNKLKPFCSSCISLNHSMLPCHDHASYCALHWLCFLSVAGNCPLLVNVVSTMWSMTPMKSYTIFRSARQAKPPCSFWYNPTLSLLLLFTALGQQRFNCYMMR